MNCADAVRVLEMTVGDTLDFDELGLPDGTRGTLLAHLVDCAGCAQVRDEIRGTSERVEAAFGADLRAEAAADRALVAAVEAALRTPGESAVSRRRASWLRPVTARPWLARAAGVFAALSAAYAWNALRAPDRPEITVANYRLCPPHADGYAGPRFDDVTAEAGVQNVDHTGVAGRKDWMVETVGHGAAVFDMDGDLDLDLFVPDGNRLDAASRVSGTWRLYRNDGGMRFTDVTAGSGLDVDSWGGGAVAGDLDGDGLPDLFVPCFGKNHLFRNLGGGKFEDATAKAGVAGLESEWGTAAALGDLDGDGDLDLYVANYADMRRYMVEARRGRDCTWRDMPVACGPAPLEAQQDRLFLNRGDGTFDDATNDRMQQIRRYSFQASILDFDRDGFLDVYVACDAQPNILFRNDGTGHFAEVGTAAGCATNGAGQEQASMGVAAGDVDDDGRIDVFVTNFSHESNSLYRNLLSPRLSFGDVTASAGLDTTNRLTLGWGAAFADLENDGDQDLLYANGHLYPDVGRHVPETTYAQHVAVFENDGLGRFREVSADAGEVLRPRVHRGLVVADFDDDGAPDLFLTVLNDRAVLLRNDGRGVGACTKFVLRRRGGRIEAAGASLMADVADVPGRTRIVRDLAIGSSFGATEDPRLVVGLGEKGRITGVRVRWPAGADAAGAAILPPQGETGFAPGAVYEVVEDAPRARRVK